MFEQEEEFQRLLQEIQRGSEEGARRFLDLYGEHILRVIRRRLHRKLRSKFDSDDFMQDVMASFFHDPPPAQAFADADAFIKYLTALANNKVIEQVRRRMVLKKHNVYRENSLEGSAMIEAQGVPGPLPTPSEEAVANEEWGGLVKDQPARFRTILQMLRSGHSHVEIAQKLNLSVKMVYRLVQKLRPRYTS